MDESVKVSIIVPVYNVPEKALRDCLESTINQTMEDIEVIVVDDGSTDLSRKICDEYAEKDRRLRVIHKKNGGLSAARNSGYEAAQGEWITFLDGDDWIEPKTCEETYRLASDKNVDIVLFGTVQEFEHYQRFFNYHYEDGTIFVGDECKKLQCEILDFNGNIATAWAKLIRKKLLDKYHIEHRSDLRQGSEGIEYNIRLFENVKSVVFSSKVYYHYIYNPNSISARHDEKNHYYVIRCFEAIKDDIAQSKNKDLETMFYTRFVYVVIATAITGYFSPRNKQSYIERKKSFKKYLLERLVSQSVKKADRRKLDLSRRIILNLIEHNCFLALQVLGRIRYRQKNG